MFLEPYREVDIGGGRVIEIVIPHELPAGKASVTVQIPTYVRQIAHGSNLLWVPLQSELDLPRVDDVNDLESLHAALQEVVAEVHLGHSGLAISVPSEEGMLWIRCRCPVLLAVIDDVHREKKSIRLWNCIGRSRTIYSRIRVRFAGDTSAKL